MDFKNSDNRELQMLTVLAYISLSTRLYREKKLFMKIQLNLASYEITTDRMSKSTYCLFLIPILWYNYTCAP